MNVKWNVLINTKEKEDSVKSQFLENLKQNVGDKHFKNVKINISDEIFSVKFNMDRDLKEQDMGFISMVFGSYLRNIFQNDHNEFIVFYGETKKIKENSYVFEANAEISEIEVLHLIKTSIRKNTINVTKLIELFK